ncbi:hypothetical protein AWB78_07038 [Caballeronia calidae]|uniref:Uncharacterized protein n=1 Tax=Caballeronia calidae TaxID=1777139 RepID=A0A158EDU9_9BURK|nr:hypothetical protein AWB78_07038 [Caballeronia calidae]
MPNFAPSGIFISLSEIVLIRTFVISAPHVEHPVRKARENVSPAFGICASPCPWIKD